MRPIPALAALWLALFVPGPAGAAPPAEPQPPARAEGQAESSSRAPDPPGARPAPSSGVLGGTRLWGSAYYDAVGADGSLAKREEWNIAQELVLAVNLRSEAGFDALGNFVFPIDLEEDSPSKTVIQQLAVKVALSDRVTLIGGKQRLNWGTAKILTAIDTLEQRPNPLDVRPLPPGVTGLKAVVIPNDWLSLTLVALPASRPRGSRAAGRVDLVLEDAGLDLGFGAVRYDFADRGLTDGDGATPIPNPDPPRHGHLALISDGAWAHGNLILYEEIQLRRGRESRYWFPGMDAYSRLERSGGPVLRGVAGVYYQLAVGLSRPVHLTAEYLYNGDGLNHAEARAFDASYTRFTRGSASGTGVFDLPAILGGIGGFRRHYLSANAQNIALARYLLLSLSTIVGVESLFARHAATLEWVPVQGTAVSLRYENFQAYRSRAEQPGELVLIPFRHRLTATFATSF